MKTMPQTLGQSVPSVSNHAAKVLRSLTGKQRSVLDLLLAHHTSKQIAQILSLSPNTIDARIAAARQKLEANDRKDLIRRYAALLEAADEGPQRRSKTDLPTASDQRKTTYGFPLVDSPPIVDDPEASGLPGSPQFSLEDSVGFTDFHGWSEAPSGPEALDARFGKSWRIAAIPIMAILVGMVLIWGLAFARTLSEVL